MHGPSIEATCQVQTQCMRSPNSVHGESKLSAWGVQTQCMGSPNSVHKEFKLSTRIRPMLCATHTAPCPHTTRLRPRHQPSVPPTVCAAHPCHCRPLSVLQHLGMMLSQTHTSFEL